MNDGYRSGPLTSGEAAILCRELNSARRRLRRARAWRAVSMGAMFAMGYVLSEAHIVIFFSGNKADSIVDAAAGTGGACTDTIRHASADFVEGFGLELSNESGLADFARRCELVSQVRQAAMPELFFVSGWSGSHASAAAPVAELVEARCSFIFEEPQRARRYICDVNERPPIWPNASMSRWRE